MVSDGCTGFWFAELLFDIHEVCVQHDLGGSDLDLLIGLLQNVPMWLWPMVLLCVGLMVLLRPIYRRFKPQITWFYRKFIQPFMTRR
jgi:hypothetical protein